MKILRWAIFGLLIVATVSLGCWYFLIKKNAHAGNISFEYQKLETPQTVSFEKWQLNNRDILVKTFEVKETSATLFFAGDIMMSRAVEKKMLAKKDFNYCLAPLTEKISGADLAFANLESPIIEGALVADGSFSFRANPKSAVALKTAGFDVLSLANNHFGNQGLKGMEKTFDYLEQQNIDYVGAGLSFAKMKNPVIKAVNGLNIAYLAYSYGPEYYAADQNHAGFALMNDMQLLADLKKAKSAAEIIVVTMHDGIEYENEPSEHQKNFAHLAIDNGADLVVGHHPHVVQKMEIYKEKYIFYSLGNFVFDQMWSTETKQGLTLLVTVNETGVTDIDYFPVVIKDYCQPNLVEGKDREAIIAKL